MLDTRPKIFFPAHPEPVCDRLKITQLAESDFILSTHGPIDKHDLPRKSQSQDENAMTKLTIALLTGPRIREFLSPPRAPHRCDMISTTGNNKTTPIVLISTANPASPSAYKGADSANASPITPFLLRPAAGPGLGCSRDLPGFFDPGSTPAAHETLRAPVGLHRQLPQERDATHLLRISFQDVERGLQEAKAEAGTYATELADSEHRQHHDMLVRNATTITTSVHHTEATITTLTQDTRERRSRLGVLQVQEGSAAAAVEASSRTHKSFTAGFGTHPWTQHPGAASPAKMAPPPTRTPQASAPVQVGQQHAIVDTRLTQAPPGGRSESPDTSAAVTSRRP